MANPVSKISDYTFGYGFLNPANCSPGSNIRALRETGVIIMKETLKRSGWDNSYKIVAIEDVPLPGTAEHDEYPIPLEEIAKMNDEEV